MKKVELQLIALNTSESSPGNYVVILESVEEKKKMAIIIGAFEAQSIAIFMERMQLPRPLTHDTLTNTIKSLNATLKEVIIHNIIDEMFHAWMVLNTADKTEIKIDTRASDALAQAVRFDCPIFVYDFVLAEAEIKETTERKSLLRGSLAEYSLEELESLLNDLLKKEDYESASRVRDMLEKRKETGK
jgi:uncharacterized protein